MFNLLSPIIVLAGLLIAAVISYLIFTLLKKFFFDGAPKNQIHRWVRRLFWFGIIPLCIFYALLFGFGLAESPYSDTAQITGATPDERFQSIAQIVSDKYKGSINVTYFDANGQPGFSVAPVGTHQSSADAESSGKSMQAYQNAIALILKRSTTEVLSTEPSIQAVVLEVLINGKQEYMFARADDLKALPSDASDRTWNAKLQMLSDQRGSSRSQSPP